MPAVNTLAIYPVRDVSVLRRQVRARRLTFFLLVVLGCSLELCYLALYPWLAGRGAKVDPLRHDWEQFWPGLTWAYQRLDWIPYVNLSWFPWHGLLYGHLYPLLVLLGASLFCIWLAVLAGNWAGRRILIRSTLYLGPLFGLILFFSILFAVTMVIAPLSLNELTRTMLVSGLYGRMVEFYYLNPYIAHSALLAHDPVQILLNYLPAQPSFTPGSVGPLWMDLSILIALISRSDPAQMILSWRVLALGVHIFNAILLWNFTSNQKPLQRLGVTLSYAWNPLVLLVGVALVHPEILLVSFLLLALFCLQRGANVLSWVCALLAFLVCPYALIILPLLFVFALRRASLQGCGWFFLCALGMLVVTVLVIFLAYIPYWKGWGVIGILLNLRDIFWQAHAINSLDAAILNMPVHLPANLSWLILPQNWSLGALTIIGCYLFFSLWFANSIETMLQCCGWLLLLWAILQPLYWPCYLFVPIVLALSSASRKTAWGALLLMLGALASYYFWQWPDVWTGQGLAVIGIPCLLWGWCIFFYATWQMALGRSNQPLEDDNNSPTFPIEHPPWASRPY
ncbi:hypothetical protein [Dictyobacter arantiisoli]|uniref:Alpha-(1->6)-mannopyranosyltransferase A n=1 Tax=Dictyobacter arantiisoli TaxID=2014874 RepID=A0A5A5TDP3_9CHLR|nr:hypothetical protein [Dictyobacter arantiisoli]GCF09306.1 hypothetical protein KDI_28700 [Dictyobacter arantiisoli]